jgi:hypothetical protein
LSHCDSHLKAAFVESTDCSFGPADDQ